MTPSSISLSDVALRFEAMRVEDLEAVLDIERQSFTTPWSRGMFLSELTSTRSARLLVARIATDPEPIVGYVGYRIVVDEMHIVLVAVHPAWRRRGIARRMLDRAMQQGRRAACRKATLEVRASNRGAQQLYFQLGFAPVGVRPGYYRRPFEEALILWREPL